MTSPDVKAAIRARLASLDREREVLERTLAQLQELTLEPAESTPAPARKPRTRRYTSRGRPGDRRPDVNPDAVLAWLVAAGGTATTIAAGEHFGAARSALRVRLLELVDAGRIEQIGEGYRARGWRVLDPTPLEPAPAGANGSVPAAAE